MNGFEIVVSQGRSVRTAPTVENPRAKVIPLRGAPKAPSPRPADGRIREAIDLVVGGVNLTARVEPDQAPCVVRDLALAIVDLACGTRRRAIVRFYDAPWELGLERIDDAVSVSVIRNGGDVEVAVHDRRTGLADAIAGTRAAIDAMLATK